VSVQWPESGRPEDVGARARMELGRVGLPCPSTTDRWSCATVARSPSSRCGCGKEAGMNSFPDDWPPGCPPADVKPAAGGVYRLVRNTPVLAVDLRTHAEFGKLPKALR
jgi:hypothetical protein